MNTTERKSLVVSTFYDSVFYTEIIGIISEEGLTFDRFFAHSTQNSPLPPPYPAKAGPS